MPLPHDFLRDMGLALTMARRELRSGMRGFGVFLACLALGVGAMSTIGLMTASLKAGLEADAARILGGDLSISLSHRTMQDQALRMLEETGSVARSARMRSMARTIGRNIGHNDTEAALTDLKAVDDAYPLYGEAVLASGRSLGEVLHPKGETLPNTIPAVVAQDLLDRLGASVGDELRIGAAKLVIGDVLVSEPDRAANAYGFGPRTIIPLSRLEETGLVTPGAVISYGYAWKAGPGENAEAVTERLQAAFPDAGWRIRGLDSAGGGLGRFVDYLGLDLSLVALATLLLGGIGVAGGVAGHLSRRDATIAAMKCLGASRRAVQATYLIQILVLALLGSALGIGLGAVGAAALCSFLAETFGMPLRFGAHPFPILTALAYGLLTALAFSLWPLSAAARTTPARLFTGYADPGTRRPTAKALFGTAACGLVLLGLTWLTAQGHLMALGFAGALVAGSLVFGLLAWLMRRAARCCRRSRDPRLALAIANLHRPGAATTPTVFSLGFGLAVLCCVVLVDGNLRSNVERIMPDTAPSYFFINVRASDWEQFKATVNAVDGVGRMEATPVIRGRITGLAGAEADAGAVAEEAQWALRGDRFLTFSKTLPANSRIAAGQWWPEDYDGPALVSLEKGLAEGFGVTVGDTMTFNVLGRTIRTTIANLREVDWTTLQLNQAVVLSPGVLESAPYTWLASVHAEPKAEKPLFKAVTDRFPDAVALYMKDILADIAGILGHVGRAAGSAAGLTLLVGLMILGEAVRGTLRTRRYDLVVFKVFGATRRDVLLSLGMEFLLQGVLAAGTAALLGGFGAWIFVTKLLHLQWTLLPGRLAAVSFGGVAAVVLLGLFGVRGVLSQKAWPLLRND